MPEIIVTPLGAGQDTGRSCILLTIGGKNVMLDCGMHLSINDERRFPDFSYITENGSLTDYLDCVIISHFHLDHCGALPYMTEMVGYDGPIFMTCPTKAMCSILLRDCRRATEAKQVATHFYTKDMIKDCLRKVTTINLHQTLQVDDELEIKPYYAGHVLGAAMFHVKVGSQSVVYTGDFNMTPDRNLGAAWIDKCKPDLLITESTYATTIRDSKLCRENDLLDKVHSCVERGGKVLIPVLAVGRAQEMCILLETYWERMNLKIPIYCSSCLTEEATNYYKLFLSWTNQKIKKTFVQRNMFDFKHIKPFHQAYIDSPGPMVVFATPLMLNFGASLQIFREWAPNENNMLIMPGFCPNGTVGHKVLSGAKKVIFEDHQDVDIRMAVECASFSAHADAEGIMQLIRACEPAKVLLVHGEATKMKFLAEKIVQEFEKECFVPENGETVTIETPPSNIPIDVSLDLLKMTMNKTDPGEEKILHGVLVMQDDNLVLMKSEQAMAEIGVVPHQIRFTSNVKFEDHSGTSASRITDAIFQKLENELKKRTVELAPDGSITVASVLIKVDVVKDDMKNISVSWSYQDEKLGNHLLNVIKDTVVAANI